MGEEIKNEEGSNSSSDTSGDTDQIRKDVSEALQNGELTAWSCDPNDIPPWTEEEKEKLNDVLGKAFGWSRPTKEQIDAAAKNIFIGCLLEDDDLKAKYIQFKSDNRVEEFVKILNTAVNTVWNGNEHEDEMEKEKYRALAKLSLKALGYKVELTNQIHIDLLV